jgi:broad specificity phosphatase PhoE
MITSRLTLISHAATEALRRTAFPLDEPLLEWEVARIKSLIWNPPAGFQLLSAPEQRTQQTSRMLSLPVKVVEILRDCGYGQWRGQTMEDVQSRDPDGILAWLTDASATPPGGESLETLVRRVGRWMNEDCIGENTIAVTHPAVIRAAIVHGLQIPLQLFWRFDIPPLTLTDLRFSRMWTVRCIGCPLGKAGTEPEDAEI